MEEEEEKDSVVSLILAVEDIKRKKDMGSASNDNLKKEFAAVKARIVAAVRARPEGAEQKEFLDKINNNVKPIVKEVESSLGGARSLSEGAGQASAKQPAAVQQRRRSDGDVAAPPPLSAKPVSNSPPRDKKTGGVKPLPRPGGR